MQVPRTRKYRAHSRGHRGGWPGQIRPQPHISVSGHWVLSPRKIHSRILGSRHSAPSDEILGNVVDGRAFVAKIPHLGLPSEREAEVQLSIAGMLALSSQMRIDAGMRTLELPNVSQVLYARNAGRLVNNLILAGQLSESDTLLAESRSVARSTSDQVATFEVELADAATAYLNDDFRTSLAGVEKATQISRSVHEPSREDLAKAWQSEILATLDRYDESLSLISHGLVAANRDRQRWSVRIWEAMRGRRLLQIGQIDDAAAALEGLADDGQAGDLIAGDAAVGVALCRYRDSQMGLGGD